LLEIDAEEAIVDHVPLDPVVVAADLHSGVEVVVVGSRSSQVQPPDGRSVGEDADHRSGAAGVDHDVACSDERNRLLDHHRAGVVARGNAQRLAGGGGIDEALQARCRGPRRIR